MDKSFKYFIPFAMFFAMISFLWKGMQGAQESVQEPLQLVEQQEAIRVEKSVASEKPVERLRDMSDKKSIEKPIEKEQLSLTETRRTFQLPTVMDPSKTVTQDIFKDRVTVLSTWASWCGVCRKGHDVLLGLSKESKESGIYWVGLNLNDKLEEAQWMLNLYGNPYNETIYDRKGRLAADYGLRGTPELLILDKAGRIQYRHRGLMSEAIWREELLPIIKSLQ